MIFGTLELEEKLQTGDKTRLDATKSYISPDESAVSKIEIEPENGSGFIDISLEDIWLDWSYSTSGVKTVTLRITTDSQPEDFTSTIVVLSPAEDNLFSVDSDLVPHEDDILTYVRDGRNSFLDKHRAAQGLILDELDSSQIWKDDGTRYTAEDIVDIQDFRKWSKFLTLKIIFESLSNAVDDVFSIKSTAYGSRAIGAKKRASLRLDSDGDGVIDDREADGVDLTTGLLSRR